MLNFNHNKSCNCLVNWFAALLQPELRQSDIASDIAAIWLPSPIQARHVQIIAATRRDAERAFNDLFSGIDILFSIENANVSSSDSTYSSNARLSITPFNPEISAILFCIASTDS